MTDAAEHYNFEAAARLRDRIIAVRRTIEGQKVVWRSRIDADLMALARAQGQACVEVFMVREGKLLGQEYFILEGTSRAQRRRDHVGVHQAVLHGAHRKFRDGRGVRRRADRLAAGAARGARPAGAGRREGARAPARRASKPRCPRRCSSKRSPTTPA